ncbi:hypothetical protein [Neptunicella sp.]|uniref:hypothetical protein n=1 Tax=Neptunicella sp. TaxID=2125986 RepID=UPI003F68FB71
MAMAFWLKRTLRVFLSVFILLFMVELLKGHRLEDAIEFSLIWSGISTVIFTATRLFYSRKGINCALCDETPASKSNDKA